MEIGRCWLETIGKGAGKIQHAGKCECLRGTAQAEKAGQGEPPSPKPTPPSPTLNFLKPIDIIIIP